MKRLLSSSVILAASLVLASCNSDPTSDFRGDPTRIVAEPSFIFVDQDDDQNVVVKLEDDQGDPLPATFEITDGGSGITVAQDPNYLGTTIGGPLQSEAQFIVTAGSAPISTGFSLAAAGLSIDIPVRVMPTVLPTAVFSNPTPAAQEIVTVTAEGYTFLPTAAISVGGNPALVLGNDGTTLTFLPVPGSTGPAQIDTVAINFLPTTPLVLPTSAELAVAGYTGREAPATAPEIPAPSVVGDSTFFYDGGGFLGADITPDGGIGAQYYRFVITEAGDYRFLTNWVGDADFDPVVCFDVDCATVQFAGTGLDHPEDGTLTLAAGTYYWATVLFAGAAEPFTLTIYRVQ
jgi:hypothetical protein